MKTFFLPTNKINISFKPILNYVRNKMLLLKNAFWKFVYSIQ